MASLPLPAGVTPLPLIAASLGHVPSFNELELSPLEQPANLACHPSPPCTEQQESPISPNLPPLESAEAGFLVPSGGNTDTSDTDFGAFLKSEGIRLGQALSPARRREERAKQQARTEAIRQLLVSSAAAEDDTADTALSDVSSDVSSITGNSGDDLDDQPEYFMPTPPFTATLAIGQSNGLRVGWVDGDSTEEWRWSDLRPAPPYMEHISEGAVYLRPMYGVTGHPRIFHNRYVQSRPMTLVSNHICSAVALRFFTSNGGEDFHTIRLLEDAKAFFVEALPPEVAGVPMYIVEGVPRLFHSV
jgi:hypothetical protein